MTAVDERPIATVTALRPRRPRTAPAPGDQHARLLAASNRLLETTARTELTAQEALGQLVGALNNAMQGGKSLSLRGLVELMERKADGLGCPPAMPGSDLERHGQVASLVQALKDYPAPFEAAVGAARTYRDTETAADFDLLWTAVDDLHFELDVRAGS